MDWNELELFTNLHSPLKDLGKRRISKFKGRKGECVCLCFQLLSHWGRTTITREKGGREGGKKGEKKKGSKEERKDGGREEKKKEKRKGNQQDTGTIRYRG